MKIATKYLVLAVSIAALVTPSPYSNAGAQTINLPKGALKNVILNVPVKSTARQSLVSGGTVATDNPLSAASALSDFRLIFRNGDHKIRGIVIAKKDSDAGFTFWDVNAGDPFEAWATWWTVAGATGGEVEASTNGPVLELPIPDGPANSTLVLGGFDIAQGYDHDIGGFSIEMNQAQKKARVELYRDVSRSDFMVVKIQYVWIPNSAIASRGSVSSGNRSITGVSGRLPPNNKYVIRNFSFKFSNGPHFLKGIGIHLNGVNDPFPIQEAVTWQDSNRDDPIAWKVDYSVLK